MTYTLLMLPLFALPALALLIHFRKQKKLEALLHTEMEAQKKALRLLGNAAIAMESGNKEESKQLLDEANALLKKRPD